MTTPLHVLVAESRRHAADEAAATLEAAGHHVHRCYEPDGTGDACAAMREGGACPIDDGIDVALAVRDRIEPRPTRYEVGVSCAIRAGIPLAERGPATLDPFAPWVARRVTDGADVVEGVAIAADRGLDDLRADIALRIAQLVPRAADRAAIRCDFERQGHRLIVHLTGPEIGKQKEQAMAVRVLDAVWQSGRTYGQVDVAYHLPQLSG